MSVEAEQVMAVEAEEVTAVEAEEETAPVTVRTNESGKFEVSFSFKIHIDEHIPSWGLALLMGTVYGFVFPAVILVINHLPPAKMINQSMPGDFVEEYARVHLYDLVSVGGRPAGSFENDIFAMKYIEDAVKDIKTTTNTDKTIEVDFQRPTGSFFMPFLDDFTSYYANITNTVIKVTSPESDQTALLLNCHTDSVVNSPGASDDAVACAILLEVLRAVAADDTPLLHPLILLFNGAEENILQGSHGFITQHKWAEQVKAFINLEAAGAGGKEYIFQAGPENPWLVWTWAKYAPYPSGSSLAQDLFQSGVFPADTDFRIFRDYGNIPGIDLAYVKNGYVYHTLHDSPAMIQPGSIQRAGENILAVVRHLLQSADSLLPDPSAYRHGATAYFDLLGAVLVVMPLRILLIVNYITFVLCFLRIRRRIKNTERTGYEFKEYVKKLLWAILISVASYLCCILCLVAVATLLTVTGRSLSWYSTPQLAFTLYVPAGLIGYFPLHSLAKEYIFKRKHNDVNKIDGMFTDATLIIWCCFIFALRNVGSCYLFTLSTFTTLVFQRISRILEQYETWWSAILRPVCLALWLIPLAVSFYHMLLVGNLFTGFAARAGSDTPPEFFMVLLFGVSMFFCCSTEVSSIVLIKSTKGWYLTFAGLLLASLCLSFSSFGFPYSADPKYPATKRFYMQHTQRQFFTRDGVLDREDSGMFICHMDFLIKNHHLGPDIVMDADFKKCEGTYCEMPFLLPIQKLVGSTQYIPMPPPSASATTDLYPLDLKWDGVTSQAENGSREVKINVAVRGPPSMAVHVAPLINGSLIGWSFASDIKDAHSKYSKDAYFILYGGGIEHPVWNFWLEFSLPSGRTDEPILELALTAHYQPSGPVSKVNTQTPELENITSQLYDWVAPMTWVSLYRNYKI